MHIFVKHQNGRTYTFEVLRTDYVREVKVKIQGKTTDPVPSQILKLRGQELEDGRPLEYYNIVEETALDLTVLPDGAAGGDDRLQFFVIIPVSNSQRTCTIRNLTRESTTKDLKDQLKMLEEVPVDRQQLTFCGRYLRDELTLGEQELYNECSVFLTFRVPGGTK